MSVKLRVLHGLLKHQDGGNAGHEVDVHAKRFVIGSGADCQMRCPSSSISPHHCEIIHESQRFFVRDLSSESGTFVNGELLKQPHVLQDGDLLRIGRLEFEVLVEKVSAAAAPPPAPPREADPVGDTISDMLVAADREDRAQRFEDPAKRRFAVQVHEPPVTDKVPSEPEKKKKGPPPRKPPMKLPPPPKIVADNTVQAAEEVLKKFFEKPKK